MSGCRSDVGWGEAHRQAAGVRGLWRGQKCHILSRTRAHQTNAAPVVMSLSLPSTPKRNSVAARSAAHSCSQLPLPLPLPAVKLLAGEPSQLPPLLLQGLLALLLRELGKLKLNV